MLYWPLRSPSSASKRLPGQCRKVSQGHGCLQTVELEPRGAFEPRECLDPFAGGELCGALVPVTEDHWLKLTGIMRYVKRNVAASLHGCGGLRYGSLRLVERDKAKEKKKKNNGPTLCWTAQRMGHPSVLARYSPVADFRNPLDSIYVSASVVSRARCIRPGTRIRVVLTNLNLWTFPIFK
jgi:hypothetical protein